MAFPTTPILDNFNRADTGPPPSGNWTSLVFAADTSGMSVASNQLATGVTVPSSAYWSASQYGPACEVYITITVEAISGATRLFLRLANPGSVGATNGYAFTVSSVLSLLIQRYDNDVATQLGATVSGNVQAGDSVGLSIGTSDLNMWYNQAGGGWTNLTSRSDSTYTAAGYLGVRESVDLTARFDNFGGGTASLAGPMLIINTGNRW